MAQTRESSAEAQLMRFDTLTNKKDATKYSPNVAAMDNTTLKKILFVKMSPNWNERPKSFWACASALNARRNAAT